MCLEVQGQWNLFAVVGDRRQDGPQSLESHSNVQQVSSKEEVVVVA